MRMHRINMVLYTMPQSEPHGSCNRRDVTWSHEAWRGGGGGQHGDDGRLQLLWPTGTVQP